MMHDKIRTLSEENFEALVWDSTKKHHLCAIGEIKYMHDSDLSQTVVKFSCG